MLPINIFQEQQNSYYTQWKFLGLQFLTVFEWGPILSNFTVQLLDTTPQYMLIFSDWYWMGENKCPKIKDNNKL